MIIDGYLRKWNDFTEFEYGKSAWNPEDTIIHGDVSLTIAVRIGYMMDLLWVTCSLPGNPR